MPKRLSSSHEREWRTAGLEMGPMGRRPQSLLDFGEGTHSMRTRRGLIASGLLSALFLFATSVADSADAAGGAGRTDAEKHVHEHATEHDDGVEHMAEDLVGTPMRVIEQQ